MLKKEMTTRLDQFVPLNDPAKKPWGRALALYPDKNAIPSSINLNQLGMMPIRTKDLGVLTLAEGNHRVARLIELLGPVAIVTFSLEFDRNYGGSLYDEMLLKVKKQGINTFADFLAICSSGHFRKE